MHSTTVEIAVYKFTVFSFEEGGLITQHIHKKTEKIRHHYYYYIYNFLSSIKLFACCIMNIMKAAISISAPIKSVYTCKSFPPLHR